MEVDLLVVGGGINGTGIARDAAGRGLSVLLVEKDDLGAHTSSASSKLIHGGLRYLEQLEFRLVRESLAERELLLRAAPHIVEPLEFVIPLGPHSRLAWMLRAGLFLYDHLGRRKILPGSRSVRLEQTPELKSGIERGLSYWDCRVQDSRLVILNAIDAAQRRATVLTRTELVDARREGTHWTVTLRAGGEETVRARALVNAGGPWAAQLFERITGAPPKRRVRLVKGSHIVLPRIYRGEQAFLLQNPDGRIVFAIPYEGRFTLVGTTDVDCNGPFDQPAISEDEIHYLLETLRGYFAAPVAREQVVWSYSGVRTLCDDGSSDPARASREYLLDLNDSGAPLLSVFGGKITTYRLLAQQALDRLKRFFPAAGEPWTDRTVLPGGDFSDGNVENYSAELAKRYQDLPRDWLARLARTYGARTEKLLDGARSLADLGEHFGAGLYAREVDYLVEHEWARSAEDVLFRRTKLGLRVAGECTARLTAYMAGR